MIVPDDLEPSEEVVPLDFTILSNQLVGAIHSRFAVRHAHALYVRAGIASRLLRLNRAQRISLARYRAKHSEDFKTLREVEGAFATGPGMKSARDIMELEIKAEILDAVIAGFDDVVKAASREMSRRDSERAPRD
jgi:hypothetical protein